MKVTLIPITEEEFPAYSELAFDGDIDMQTRYGTIKEYETPAERNIKNVMESSKQYALKYYKVELEEQGEKKEIGFSISLKVNKQTLLYSFGINIDYRKGDILKSWLSELDKKLGANYQVPLFLKNTRAIRFFTKNGFTHHRIEEENKGILMWR